MTDITINIGLPQYLAQWFLHAQGGVEPVKLDKGSVESKVLQVFLTRPPKDYVPEQKKEGQIAIFIPDNKTKDPLYYNYLPKNAQDLLVSCIHDRFVIELFTDINKLNNMGIHRKKLIRAWMQSHGIEYSGTNWDVIEKNYMRAANAYRQNLHRQKEKNKK